MNSEIGIIKSRDRRIDSLMESSKKYGPETQAIAEDIAKRFGGYTTPLNYKSRRSISRKYQGGGDIFREVKDSARTTIIVPQESIEAVLGELRRNGRFARLKRQDDPNSGYKGNIVNLAFGNGFQTEIQVNTERMIYAKEKISDAVRVIGAKRYREIYSETGMPGGWGHRYYETTREKNRLSRKGKVTNRDHIDNISCRIYYDIFK